MSLLESIINLDKELLLNLNSHHTPFLDNFYWIVTQTITWIPLYLTIIYFIVKSQKKGSLITIISLILMITLCDQISTNIFKEGFERLRPSHDPSIKNLIHLVANYKGGSFGFVSSHATNSFALATFISLLFRNRLLSFSIFIWAFLNSYSRIYLGVHYPGDILGGLILGIAIALLVYFIYLRVFPRFVYIPHNTKLALKKEMALSFKRYYPLTISFTIFLIFSMLLITAKIYLKIS